GDKLLVVVERLFVLKAIAAESADCGVGMRAGNHDVVAGDAEAFGDELAGLVADAAMQAEQVADDNRDLSRPIVEYQTAGVELVMDVLRRDRQKTADDPASQLGSDIAGRRPGFE